MEKVRISNGDVFHAPKKKKSNERCLQEPHYVTLSYFGFPCQEVT